MKLYLVHFDLVRFGGDTRHRTPNLMRLVWADTEEECSSKLEKHFGPDIIVFVNSISEAIS